jgi:hypothetical protein
MTMNSKEAALQRIKQLHIHSTQGYSGVLTRESQIVFNYVTAHPDAEISLTQLPLPLPLPLPLQLLLLVKLPLQ